jgi:hypothetical protein
MGKERKEGHKAIITVGKTVVIKVTTTHKPPVGDPTECTDLLMSHDLPMRLSTKLRTEKNPDSLIRKPK